MSWLTNKTSSAAVLLSVILLLTTACGQGTPPPPSETPLPSATPQPSPTSPPTPTPLPDLALDIDVAAGDPEAGYLAAIRYRCHGCHVHQDSTAYGPRFTSSAELPNIMARGEIRITDSAYTGKATTGWEYVIESIFLPEAYLVPGDWEEDMPTLFHFRLSEEELADIIAWMETFP